MRSDKTIVCPYCFEEFPLNKIHYMCTNHRCVNHGKTFQITPNKEFGSQCFDIFDICPDCGEKSYLPACPKCKHPIPSSLIKGKELIIAVIGNPKSGKSSYLGVLIHELSERIAPAFGGSFEPANRETDEEYNRRYGDQLYREHAVIKQLDKTRMLFENPIPFIYSWFIERKSIFRNIVDIYTIVFYDLDIVFFGIADDKRDELRIAFLKKCIYKSNGIIFLKDPLTIEHVKNQLDPETIKRASPASDEISIADVSEIIKNCRIIDFIPPNEPIDKPIALTLSKFDVIKPIVSLPYATPNSPHCKKRKLDIFNFEFIDEKVRAILSNWGMDGLVCYVDKNYKKRAFFCTSAFGLNNNADNNGKIAEPHPYRIEDAFLWILAENGVIPND